MIGNGNGGNTSFNIPMVPAGGGYGGYGGGFGYPMPVMPMSYGNSGWGNGFGGDWGWIILLLLAFNGGWGGFGGGFNGWGDGGFPWILAANQNLGNQTSDGFQHASTQNQLNGIQTAINTGFSNAEVSNCNRAMDQMQTAYNNEISALNRSFAAQTALDQRLDTLAMDQYKCCCETREAIAAANAQNIQEHCNDRHDASNNTRDIIQAVTAGNQRILDQLCNDKIDEKNERIVALQNQLNMASLRESQEAQTARLIQDNNMQTLNLIQRIAPYPVPAYPVNNPYGCQGYGFGNGNFGFNGGFGFGNGNFAGPVGTF